MRARDIAAPVHLGALIAPELRIHGLIRDAVWAGGPSPWEDRGDASV